MKPLDPRLLRHVAAARTHLLVSVGVGAATAALVLVQAEVVTGAIARVVDGGGIAVVRGALGVLAAVVVARAALVWVGEVTGRRAAATVGSTLRRLVVRRGAAPHTDGAPGADRAAMAVLATRGLDALDGYVARYVPRLVLAVVVPVAVLVRLALADVTAAVIVAVTLPLVPLFMVLVGRATEAASARRWRALTRLSHHLLDVVTGMATLRAFGRGAAQREAVGRSSERYRTTTMATLRVAFLSSLVLELLATLSVALVAVSVGLRLVDGGLDLRTGLLVVVLAPEAYLPLRLLGADYHASAEGLAAVDDAFAVIDAPRPPVGAGLAVPAWRVGGAVVVDDVAVGHPGRAVVAPAATSFELTTGSIVAVVGPSGSGKTTLARVVLGLCAPTNGSVHVRGARRGADVGLDAIDPAAWHRQLAWVPQHPYLALGTVADNVRLGAPAASDRSVAVALAAVGLGAEAGRAVGEGGVGLSSGERRRVAIARALVRDAALIVLDEPTAGLDGDAETAVLGALRSAAGHAAVLVATHRPEVVAAADRVVRLRSEAADELAGVG